MAYNFYFLAKHILIFKSPKKSSILLTMVVLIFSMVFGVYICSVSLRQISNPSRSRVEVVQPYVEPSEKTFVHYPISVPSTKHSSKPETYVEPSEIPFVHLKQISVPSTKPATYVEPSEKPFVHFPISVPSTSNFSKTETYVEPSEKSFVHLKQISAPSTKPATYVEPLEKSFVRLPKTETIGRLQVVSPCKQPYVEPSEKPFVHFPKPRTFSRAECACNPVRYFAILSTQRSGTGWLVTLLNSHTNISSNGEIFYDKARQSNVSSIVETLDQLYSLELFTKASKNECTAAVGLKWMLNQGLMEHHKEILKYFNTRGVSIIFFFRRNLLRKMISKLANLYDHNASQMNGRHHPHVRSPQVAEILARYKPKITTKLLIPKMRQVEQMVAKALEYFNSTRHIALYYEDIMKNRTKLIDIQDFLGVPRMELSSNQVKIHRGSLPSLVANWRDVQKKLKGTPYESFLQADYEM